MQSFGIEKNAYEKLPLDAKRRTWLLAVAYTDNVELNILGKPEVQNILAKWVGKGEADLSDEDWELLHQLAMRLWSV